MATHEMRLHAEPFYKFKDGIKTIEVRLFDEKRRKINVWDHIRFTNRDNTSETLFTQVDEIFRYSTFNDLFKDLYEKYFGYCDRKELENCMDIYYPREEQNKFGVIGIKVHILLDQ